MTKSTSSANSERRRSHPPSRTLAERATDRTSLLKAIGAVQPRVGGSERAVPEPRRSVLAAKVEAPPVEAKEPPAATEIPEAPTVSPNPQPRSVEQFDMSYFFDGLANGYN